MASNIYQEILAKAMKRAPGTGETKALVVDLALEQKRVALSSTIAIRRSDGEDVTPEEMKAAEDAASDYVDSVIAGMVSMDLDKLIQQNKRTKSKKLAEGKVSGGALRRKKVGNVSVFISPKDLRTLLNSMLFKYAQQLMGTGGRLVNRTGRLAHSGFVTKITDSTGKKAKANSMVSVYFRYMMEPYEHFEPYKNGPRASKARSPSDLFRDALNNALTDILEPQSFKRIKLQWLNK